MKKCIYTVITGKYDYPFAHSVKRPDFDYICFTDDDQVTSDFWEIRLIPEELKELDIRRQSRAIKIRPHLYLADYDYSIYIDANCDLTIFPQVNDNLLTVNRHEVRNCLYAEANAVQKLGLEDPVVLTQQTTRYREFGVPGNAGLWHCNYIGRHHNNPTCIAMMEDWWEEVCNYSWRDQISFAYVMWKYKYNPLPVGYGCETSGHIKYGRQRDIITPRTYNAEINPRIAVCCIERMENQYIREFVNHYRSLGFGHIFMYDTNSPEQDDVTEVIGDYIANDYVSLIKWEGRPMWEVREAFNDCYRNRLSNYDWCLFVDPDEFLELYKEDNITDYVSRLSNFDIIRINWRTMDDNDLLTNSGLPLRQRFTRTSNHDSDRNYKSLVRTNLPYIDFVHQGSAHGPYASRYSICDNEGNPVTTHIHYPFIMNYNWNDAALLHYRCKTVEEYVTNKIPKLEGYKSIDFDMRFFFEYNIPTPQKIELYERLIEQGASPDQD